MVVLMKKLDIILIIIWRTRFNFEIIEGLLTNDALDMCDEPEKMNVLTKLSKHLPSRKKIVLTIPQTHPTTQSTSGNFFPFLYLNQTIIQSHTPKNKLPISDLSARIIFRTLCINM